VKAAFAVNSALIGLYWELDKMISNKQTSFGKNFLEKVSKKIIPHPIISASD